MKIDILAFGAHPDDVELGCGATLAKMVSLGKKVVIVDLTQGELGSNGTIQTRYKEAEEASEILGINQRINLKMEDGFFINDKENQLKIIQIIRHFKPEIIFCNAPSDRHPDHAKASKLIVDSVFFSGLIKIKTEYNNQVQEHFRPKNIYKYIQWIDLEPDFLVDVTGFQQKKLDSCLAYKTQFYQENNSNNSTPINSKNFIESVLYRMKNFGRISGVDFAEGFLAERKIIIKNIFDLY